MPIEQERIELANTVPVKKNPIEEMTAFESRAETDFEELEKIEMLESKARTERVSFYEMHYQGIPGVIEEFGVEKTIAALKQVIEKNDTAGLPDLLKELCPEESARPALYDRLDKLVMRDLEAIRYLSESTGSEEREKREQEAREGLHGELAKEYMLKSDEAKKSTERQEALEKFYRTYIYGDECAVNNGNNARGAKFSLSDCRIEDSTLGKMFRAVGRPLTWVRSFTPELRDVIKADNGELAAELSQPGLEGNVATLYEKRDEAIYKMRLEMAAKYGSIFKEAMRHKKEVASETEGKNFAEIEAMEKQVLAITEKEAATPEGAEIAATLGKSFLDKKEEITKRTASEIALVTAGLDRITDRIKTRKGSEIWLGDLDLETETS